MWHNIGLDHALSFINCQMKSPGAAIARTTKPVAVTISRMTGSGGRTVAAQLAEFLQERAAGHCPWTVFDRELVEKALEEHDLPRQMANYMPENHRSLWADTVEEFLGLHPSAWTLVQQTSETIWHLARMGNVILVGRGANLITRKLETAFHVRLVGSLEKRAVRIQEVFKLSSNSALDFIKQEDQGRRRYLKEHFGKDIDDPLLYHLIINTDELSYADATVLIGNAVIAKFQLNRPN